MASRVREEETASTVSADTLRIDMSFEVILFSDETRKVTAPCEIDDFCYKNTMYIQRYLNTAEIWEALDVPSAVRNYSVASFAVQMAFVQTNDLGISMQPQVQYLLANQIDVLIYQGNLDLACNTAGNLRWANNMPWKGQAEFASQGLRSWMSPVDGKEKKAGTYKDVYIKMKDGDKRRTRFALVTIDNSGHMVILFPSSLNTSLTPFPGPTRST